VLVQIPNLHYRKEHLKERAVNKINLLLKIKFTIEFVGGKNSLFLKHPPFQFEFSIIVLISPHFKNRNLLKKYFTRKML
jgi:hypothetical protein